MLELILQQRYRVNGIPVDISPYRNHGTGVDTLKVPGPAPDHDVVQFPNPTSRIKIGLGTQKAWSPLVALKIEVLARVNPVAARTLTLVAGDGSFRFRIMEKALEASFEGLPGDGTYIRSDSTYSPDHLFHAVPVNRWTTFGFYHDGFAKMRLQIDRGWSARRRSPARLPPLQEDGR